MPLMTPSIDSVEHLHPFDVYALLRENDCYKLIYTADYIWITHRSASGEAYSVRKRVCQIGNRVFVEDTAVPAKSKELV